MLTIVFEPVIFFSRKLVATSVQSSQVKTFGDLPDLTMTGHLCDKHLVRTGEVPDQRRACKHGAACESVDRVANAEVSQ